MAWSAEEAKTLVKEAVKDKCVDSWGRDEDDYEDLSEVVSEACKVLMQYIIDNAP